MADSSTTGDDDVQESTPTSPDEPDPVNTPSPPDPPDPPAPPDDGGRTPRRVSTIAHSKWTSLILALVGVIAAVLALQPVFDSWSESGASVQVVDYGTGQGTSPNLILPRSINEIDRPPPASDQAAFTEWSEDNDAVYADNMSVGFTATSDQASPTIITNVRVEVVRREPPLAGTWVVPDGAGPQGERIILANLDADPPTATLDGTFEFPLRVNDEDTELFSIRARATNCHCFWRIELDVIDNDSGETRTLTVDDHGQPFEVTGTVNATQRTYLPSSAGDSWPKLAN